MKKLLLALLTISVIICGCFENKKNAQKTQNHTQIKTVDELFAAIEEKSKDQKEVYPKVQFCDLKGYSYQKGKKKLNYRSQSITVTINNKSEKFLHNEKNATEVLFYTEGETPFWLLSANKELLKKTFIKEANPPSMLINNKTTKFRNFFKSINLAKDLVNYENYLCYKLIATTDDKNNLERETDVIYYIDTNSLNVVFSEYETKIHNMDYNVVKSIIYTIDENKKAVNNQNTYLLIDKNTNKPFFKLFVSLNKTVYDVPFHKRLLECPENKNDYQLLQDYFNMLLKNYYDNKYQIEIK
ncbi:hypothetical protein AAEX28_16020 [Lentisphaerota bacterium WC36G]|nr:hypothetical protein LJT99_02780 [Lentisphaerae bacterium WC36]